MPCLARVVAPWLPRDMTQRGNRPQQTFFAEADHAARLDLARRHERAHRRLGSEGLLARLERLLGCVVRRQQWWPPN